jgi:hypothetical protein
MIVNPMGTNGKLKQEPSARSSRPAGRPWQQKNSTAIAGDGVM